LPITKAAVALPLPSYSLKVVEEYVGFKRTQDEYGGSWAMAQFILATETEDEGERNLRMAEILKYNEEDLAATWAVFEWLRNKSTVLGFLALCLASAMKVLKRTLTSLFFVMCFPLILVVSFAAAGWDKLRRRR
jgi:hypothetical protein